MIKHEVNVKEVELLEDASDILVKQIKPNFKALGPKLGADMKTIASKITAFSQQEIAELEQKGSFTITESNKNFEITLEDVEIGSEAFLVVFISLELNEDKKKTNTGRIL